MNKLNGALDARERRAASPSPFPFSVAKAALMQTDTALRLGWFSF